MGEGVWGKEKMSGELNFYTTLSKKGEIIILITCYNVLDLRSFT
jgi:hypothetical protein